MATIGIIGYGYVGKAVHYGFKDIADIKIYDIKQLGIPINTLSEVCDCDYIFICVPTPPLESGECDTSIVEEAVRQCFEHQSKGIIIIKSTVAPETTQALQQLYPSLNIIFNPEFLREKTYLDDFMHPSRIIIGGDDKLSINKVIGLYKQIFPTTPIYPTDSTTAELAKLTANYKLALEVIFWNHIYQICQGYNIQYDSLVEMVTKDPRITSSHSGSPQIYGWGYGGKCLPKDTNDLLYCCKKRKIDCSPLDTVIKKNNKLRRLQ